MAKKRRTKAQKQRAAIHRQEQLKAVFTPAVQKLKPQVRAKAQAPAATKVEAKPIDFRRRDLKRSVVVLGSLIVIQVLVWLIFSGTNLDDQLYNWIKL